MLVHHARRFLDQTRTPPTPNDVPVLEGARQTPDEYKQVFAVDKPGFLEAL